jgi:hypothetical protein
MKGRLEHVVLVAALGADWASGESGVLVSGRHRAPAIQLRGVRVSRLSPARPMTIGANLEAKPSDKSDPVCGSIT